MSFKEKMQMYKDKARGKYAQYKEEQKEQREEQKEEREMLEEYKKKKYKKERVKQAKAKINKDVKERYKPRPKESSGVGLDHSRDLFGLRPLPQEQKKTKRRRKKRKELEQNNYSIFSY